MELRATVSRKAPSLFRVFCDTDFFSLLTGHLAKRQCNFGNSRRLLFLSSLAWKREGTKMKENAEQRSESISNQSHVSHTLLQTERNYFRDGHSVLSLDLVHCSRIFVRRSKGDIKLVLHTEKLPRTSLSKILSEGSLSPLLGLSRFPLCNEFSVLRELARDIHIHK